MQNDFTPWIAAWGAILSTIVFLWDIHKFRSQAPILRIDEPMIKQSAPYWQSRPEGGLSYLTSKVLSIPTINPRGKLEHTREVYLLLPKGDRIQLREIKLHEGRNFGSSVRPFNVEPYGRHEFSVWGAELAKQIEDAGYQGEIKVTVIAKDDRNKEFSSKPYRLLIDDLKGPSLEYWGEKGEFRPVIRHL